MERFALLAAVILASFPTFAGEYLMNEEVAYGLQVTFSEPVRITQFGDVLMVMSPEGESAVFTFSGAELPAWVGHSLAWTPATARIIDHEWLASVPQAADQWESGRNWSVQYTEVFFDDFDTLTYGIGDHLILAEGGRLSGNDLAPVQGNCSVVGQSDGSRQYLAYLRTSATLLRLTPGHRYTVSFDYRILETPDVGFEVLFYSPEGGAAGDWIPSTNVVGTTGDTGSAVLTGTLLSYSDYEIRWNVISSGAIAIDNIEVLDLTEGSSLFVEDCEREAPGLRPELRLLGDGGSETAEFSEDLNSQAAQGASVVLTNLGEIVSHPDRLWLPGGVTYIVEFDYRILVPGSRHGRLLEVWFQLAGRDVWYRPTTVQVPVMFSNEPASGRFSGGVALPDRGDYYIIVRAADGASVAIDNLRILSQAVAVSDEAPSHWEAVSDAPFPRLGNYLMGTTHAMAYGQVEGTPFMYSVSDIEQRAALSDVIAGFAYFQQTRDPAFAKRIRELNPSTILLPYRIAGEAGFEDATWGRRDSGIEVEQEYLDGIADEWIVKTVAGDDVPDHDWTFIKKLNIYDTCPVVNEVTFTDYLVRHILEDVLPSGLWDGIYLDNLFAKVNPHIPDSTDRSLLDFDCNNNGLRDETPASISEQTRQAAIALLTAVREEVGMQALVVGNTGPHPQLALAGYVNGFLFESFNKAWEHGGPTSEAQWKLALDEYLYMDRNVLWPAINILEGSGQTGAFVEPDRAYPAPLPEDFRKHRLAMGTTLLGNGFYEYDLFDGRSAPYWFDEFTVDSTGEAVEDAAYKGYLGRALGDPQELRSPERTVWSEGFGGSAYPSAMWGSPQARVLGGSLRISNWGEHTRVFSSAGTVPSIVTLRSGETYVIESDWRIVETIDSYASIGIWGDGFEKSIILPGVVQGDSGSVRFPVFLDTGSDFSVGLVIGHGAGVVAFDNIRILEGGAGPWRRDFERGFVLVNPFPTACTLALNELQGIFDRTGIRRINGSQDQSVNNGEWVRDSLTIGPFDAIILLADYVAAE